MAANQSKERILAGAKELFLARGYAATTVDAICEKAELTKGSFYYFFDSKEDLGLAVLDWSLQRSAQMLASGPHLRIVDPLEKAFAFLEHLEKCSPEIWSGGCLLGSFSLELADTNSRMQQAVAGMFQAVADDFAKQLQPIAAQCAGEQVPRASEFADTLLGILEGSSQERLIAAVRQRAQMPLAELFRELLADAQRFACGRKFGDDVCLVAMKVARAARGPA